MFGVRCEGHLSIIVETKEQGFLGCLNRGVSNGDGRDPSGFLCVGSKEGAFALSQ